jgi:two-component system, response regulator PdtaR
MKKNKVLIVEDEFIIQLFIARTLRKGGLEIVGEASSSEEAILIIDKNRPDLILMDIGIKGALDGIEAARFINSVHRIPIAFITGNSDLKTLERASSVHPLAILFKPLDERRLFDKVQELLTSLE